MDGQTITLAIGLLTFISGMASLIISRRKITSEAHTMDADAFEKFQSTLTKLQDRNDALYQENVTLQVNVTTATREKEQLVIRLQERDAQLTAATRQLDLLRDLAKTANITETLQQQLAATNDVISKLQAAQKDLQQMVIAKEKAYQDLFDSTRLPAKLPKQEKT